MKNTECAQSNTISSRSLAWLRQNQSEFRGTLWRTPWRWRWNPASSRGPAGRWRAWRRILWQRSWWLTRKCKWRWKCTWKRCSQGRWDAAPLTPVLYFKGGVKLRSKISSKLKVKGNMLKRKERITCISFLLNWLVTCNSNTDAPVTEPACLSGLSTVDRCAFTRRSWAGDPSNIILYQASRGRCFSDRKWIFTDSPSQ